VSIRSILVLDVVEDEIERVFDLVESVVQVGHGEVI